MKKTLMKGVFLGLVGLVGLTACDSGREDGGLGIPGFYGTYETEEGQVNTRAVKPKLIEIEGRQLDTFDSPYKSIFLSNIENGSGVEGFDGNRNGVFDMNEIFVYGLKLQDALELQKSARFNFVSLKLMAYANPDSLEVVYNHTIENGRARFF